MSGCNEAAERRVCQTIRSPGGVLAFRTAAMYSMFRPRGESCGCVQSPACSGMKSFFQSVQQAVYLPSAPPWVWCVSVFYLQVGQRSRHHTAGAEPRVEATLCQLCVPSHLMKRGVCLLCVALRDISPTRPFCTRALFPCDLFLFVVVPPGPPPWGSVPVCLLPVPTGGSSLWSQDDPLEVV